jgi:hypothetical protein
MWFSVLLNVPEPPPQLAGARASVVGVTPVTVTLLNAMVLEALLATPAAVPAVK